MSDREREAEDRAVSVYGGIPVGENMPPIAATALEVLWPVKEKAFRDGFRAALKIPRHSTNDYTANVGASYIALTDTELSKIRDRLNALEFGQSNITSLVEEMERIDAKLDLQGERIEMLERKNR